MTVGSNIRKLRIGRGLTQDKLAERLFVTRQTVSNWERGASQPDLVQLEAIAAALGVAVMELLYGLNGEERPERKRLLAGGICLAGAVILWVIGKLWLVPQIEYWVQRYFQMGRVYIYKFVYEGAMVYLFVLGALFIASGIWNLSLKKKGRRICLGIGMVIGLIWLISWGCVLAMAVTEWSEPFRQGFLYLIRFLFEPLGTVMEGLAILLLFLSLDRTKKNAT